LQEKSKKCFGNVTPVPLPTEKDSDETWTKFKEAYAKDACNIWENANMCFKPPVQLIEKCLDQDGFITGILETTRTILCDNQDAEELSKRK
jgi:hypothetical protein